MRRFGAIALLTIVTGMGQSCGVKKNFVAYNSASCTSDLTTCVTTPPPSATPPPLGPRTLTAPKVMAATAAVTNITFNLGTELVGASFPGVSFIIAVNTIQPPGAATASYVFDNPRLSTNGTGGTPIHVSDIRIMINGTLITYATAYATVDRYIAAGQVNRNLTDGAMTVNPASAPTTDTLTISFGKVEGAPGYNPPTLTQLRAATGVFGSRCVTCHNATVVSGGLNMALNNGAGSLFGNLRVLPFDATNSKVIDRMSRDNASAGVMPTTGWPNGAEQGTAVDLVRQWILDGAPVN